MWLTGNLFCILWLVGTVSCGLHLHGDKSKPVLHCVLHMYLHQVLVSHCCWILIQAQRTSTVLLKCYDFFLSLNSLMFADVCRPSRASTCSSHIPSTQPAPASSSQPMAHLWDITLVCGHFSYNLPYSTVCTVALVAAACVLHAVYCMFSVS